jgi:hypothetical protein
VENSYNTGSASELALRSTVDVCFFITLGSAVQLLAAHARETLVVEASANRTNLGPNRSENLRFLSV